MKDILYNEREDNENIAENLRKFSHLLTYFPKQVSDAEKVKTEQIQEHFNKFINLFGEIWKSSKDLGLWKGYNYKTMNSFVQYRLRRKYGNLS